MTTTVRNIIDTITGRTLIELGSLGKLSYSNDENAVYMKTTNLGGLNIVIRYNEGTDLYDIKAGKIRNFEFKITEDLEGVYADQLNEVLYGFAARYAR